MKMKKYIIKRYGLFCPKCSFELNWYAGMSSRTNILKCLQCNKYYIKEADKDEVMETNYADGLDKILQYNSDHKNYQGTPSSTYFAPKWLNRFLKK